MFNNRKEAIKFAALLFVIGLIAAIPACCISGHWFLMPVVAFALAAFGIFVHYLCLLFEWFIEL